MEDMYTYIMKTPDSSACSLSSSHIRAASPRRPKKVQNADQRKQRSSQIAVGSHRTASDGAYFEHAQNKRRGNAVM